MIPRASLGLHGASGRPPAGYFTRATAEAAMRTFLSEHANDRPGVLIPSFGVLADA